MQGRGLVFSVRAEAFAFEGFRLQPCIERTRGIVLLPSICVPIKQAEAARRSGPDAEKGEARLSPATAAANFRRPQFLRSFGS